MTDPFSGVATGISGPANVLQAVTPNDSEDLAVKPRALFIGGPGAIVLRDSQGNEVSLQIAAAPAVLPVRAVRVLATGTTATNIIALW